MNTRDLYYSARRAARSAQYLECFERGRDWTHDVEAAAYGVLYRGPATAQVTRDMVALIVYSLTRSDTYHAETCAYQAARTDATAKALQGLQVAPPSIPIPSPWWW